MKQLRVVIPCAPRVNTPYHVEVDFVDGPIFHLVDFSIGRKISSSAIS
jgi:hypothetical protein